MDLREDLGRAGAALAVLRRAPHLLGYAAAAPFVLVGATLAPFALLWAVGLVFGPAFVLAYPVGLPVACVTCGLAWAAVQVATCHEVDELFRGRRPEPLSGVRFVWNRPETVVATGAASSFGAILGPVASALDLYEAELAAVARLPADVVAVVVPPVVATGDGPLGADLRRAEALAGEFDRAAAVSIGIRGLVVALTWSTIVLALVIGAVGTVGYFLGWVPAIALVIPKVVGPSGLVVGLALDVVLRAVFSTALFRRAVDGEFPPAIAGEFDGHGTDADSRSHRGTGAD